MSPLLVSLLGMLLIPLFISSWRFCLLGVSGQGLLMAWMAYRTHPDPLSLEGMVVMADLALIRGIGVPVALYQVLHSRNVPHGNDLVSPNLLSWTLALGMVLLAFNFAALLVDVPGEPRYVVAVAASGVMLGLLILATPSGILSQLVGALYIENAVALFEHIGHGHPESIGLRLGQIAVVTITFLFYRWYLAKIGTAAETDAPEALERPAL
jgi:hydrogenase-4 membrane subunit HyfE